MDGTDAPATAEDHQARAEAALQLAEKYVHQQEWTRVAAFSALATAHLAAAAVAK